MKKTMAFLLLLQTAFLLSCTTSTDDGDDFDAAKVCPLNGRGTFTDDRDGQVYKYTTIGNQVWMAENLKYDAEYSVCLDEYVTSNKEKINGFCEKYGRYYSLQKNGMYDGLLNDSLIKSVCPLGWHVPSLSEWMVMLSSIGWDDAYKSSDRLRIEKDWPHYHVGTNDCLFSAYPAGAYFNDQYGVDYFDWDAIFWTSTVDSLGNIKTIKIANDVVVFNNLPKMSIRCVKD